MQVFAANRSPTLLPILRRSALSPQFAFRPAVVVHTKNHNLLCPLSFNRDFFQGTEAVVTFKRSQFHFTQDC